MAVTFHLDMDHLCVWNRLFVPPVGIDASVAA